MKNTYPKIKLEHILFVIVIIDLTFQWFGYIPVLQRQYIFIFIGLILSFIYARNFFVKPAFGWMLLYMFVVIINYLTGDIYFNEGYKLYNEFFPLFFSASLIFFLFEFYQISFVKLLIIAFCIFLIHTTIVSYLANDAFPGIMRFQSNKESVNEVGEILYFYRRIGLSDYGLPHALCVIIPGCVYLSRTARGFFRLFFIVLVFTSWLLSYVSGSFTALVLSSVSLVLALLVNPNKSKRTLYRIVFVSIISLPLIVSNNAQKYFLETIESILPETSIASEKIHHLQLSVEYGEMEGGLVSRQEKLDLTLVALSHNLIIGTNELEAGGHNALIDRFAYLGLLGMIPFCVFLFYQFEYIKRHIDGPIRYYLYIGFGCGFLMMLVKGMFIWSMWLFLFVLLPGMLYWRVPANNTTIK